MKLALLSPVLVALIALAAPSPSQAFGDSQVASFAHAAQARHAPVSQVGWDLMASLSDGSGWVVAHYFDGLPVAGNASPFNAFLASNGNLPWSLGSVGNQGRDASGWLLVESLLFHQQALLDAAAIRAPATKASISPGAPRSQGTAARSALPAAGQGWSTQIIPFTLGQGPGQQPQFSFASPSVTLPGMGQMGGLEPLAAPVPEPSTYGLFATGLAGLCWRLRRRAVRAARER